MYLSPTTQSFINFIFLLNFYDFLYTTMNYTFQWIKDFIISKLIVSYNNDFEYGI